MKLGNLVAIIRDVSPENIVPLTEALLSGGIDSVEVSLSNESKGLGCLRALSNAFSEKLHLGVGTVINQKQSEKAKEAGAQYVIMPGWDRKLVQYIQQLGLYVIPGVFSPGEIMQATSENIEVLKLFPAVTLGAEYIKQLSGPFPDLDLMAVGGVNKQNLHEFLSAGVKRFGIGSDLVPRGATEGDVETVYRNAKTYVRLLDEGMEMNE